MGEKCRNRHADMTLPIGLRTYENSIPCENLAEIKMPDQCDCRTVVTPVCLSCYTSIQQCFKTYSCVDCNGKIRLGEPVKL